MTHEQELQELRMLENEYRKLCAAHSVDMLGNHLCSVVAGCTSLCTILADGACPRPSAPDRWYHDRVVAEAVREDIDAMRGWSACDCGTLGCEHHIRWQRANVTFNDARCSDSERRAQGGE